LGRTAPEIDRIVSETLELLPENAHLSFLSAHLRLERDPHALSALADTLVNKAKSLGYEIASSDRNNLRADLAVTAGDLEVARNELRLISNPDDREPRIVLRLALSSGATQQDRELLFGIPDWLNRLDLPRMLVALELLDRDERWQTIAKIDDASLSSVARALEDPTALIQSRQFAQLVGLRSLEVRAAVFLAAARRLAGVSGPDAARARLVYLEQARALALPGELPVFQ